MKNLYFFSIVFLFSGISFAGDNVGIAEVLEWKFGPVASTVQENSDDTSPNPKMKIVDWKSMEPIPSDDEISNLTTEYLQSQDFRAKRFDTTFFMGELYQTLSPDSVLKLAPYTGILREMLDLRDFKGIKELLAGLSIQGILNEEESAVVLQCFLDQNIDLNKW